MASRTNTSCQWEPRVNRPHARDNVATATYACVTGPGQRPLRFGSPWRRGHLRLDAKATALVPRIQILGESGEVRNALFESPQVGQNSVLYTDRPKCDRTCSFFRMSGGNAVPSIGRLFQCTDCRAYRACRPYSR